MRNHKVLKNLEFHTDSIQALFINDNFNKILSGSRNGEIFLTTLPLGCYYQIDNIDQHVTSLCMNEFENNFSILSSTANSKILEYVSNNIF